MAESITFRNTLVTGISDAYPYFSLHTADPGTTGANEVAGIVRQQTVWAAAANGQRVGSEVTLSVPAGITVTHWGQYSSASGASFGKGGPLPQAESYGGSGVYRLTPTQSA